MNEPLCGYLSRGKRCRLPRNHGYGHDWGQLTYPYGTDEEQRADHRAQEDET